MTRPYGTERVCNALRFSASYSQERRSNVGDRILDGVRCARCQGSAENIGWLFNVERMLKRVLVGKEACCFPCYRSFDPESGKLIWGQMARRHYCQWFVDIVLEDVQSR